MVLWVILTIEHPIAIGLSFTALSELLGKRFDWSLEGHIVDIIFFATYFPALTVWNMATFRRRNMIKLAEKMGVKFINKLYYYSLIEILGVYSFARGYWDHIYIAAKMDIPFFAYAGHKRVKLSKLKGDIEYSGGDTPDYMREESRIDLYSLIKGPYNIDVAIKLEDGKVESPLTGCPEIDESIKKHLAGVQHFNARLVFNKDCLRMAIIGGSWEGKRFGNKIQKGFEMFKQIDDALMIKYPVASWDKYQVKWNKSEESFYLTSLE